RYCAAFTLLPVFPNFGSPSRARWPSFDRTLALTAQNSGKAAGKELRLSWLRTARKQRSQEPSNSPRGRVSRILRVHHARARARGESVPALSHSISVGPPR